MDLLSPGYPRAYASGLMDKIMSRKNLAVKRDQNGNGGRPHSLRVEHAAENVSNELDKVIHERMRLGIISALAANEKLSFSDLKSLLNTTDGNVSVHARKLEDAGYVTMKEIILRPHAADRIQDHFGGPQSARTIPEPHGSAHQGDEGGLVGTACVSGRPVRLPPGNPRKADEEVYQLSVFSCEFSLFEPRLAAMMSGKGSSGLCPSICGKALLFREPIRILRGSAAVAFDRSAAQPQSN